MAAAFAPPMLKVSLVPCLNVIPGPGVFLLGGGFLPTPPNLKCLLKPVDQCCLALPLQTLGSGVAVDLLLMTLACLARYDLTAMENLRTTPSEQSRARTAYIFSKSPLFIFSLWPFAARQHVSF